MGVRAHRLEFLIPKRGSTGFKSLAIIEYFINFYITHVVSPLSMYTHTHNGINHEKVFGVIAGYKLRIFLGTKNS